MTSTIFVEFRFWLLIVLSFLAPYVIYRFLYRTLSVSRVTVAFFGALLLLIAGIDVYLLQVLQTMARASKSIVDDMVFVSELSVALYILPVSFAGVGINLISHVLTEHLTKAEARYRDEHPDSR
ncbi:MAG: hypothetical protein JWQ11_3995 [Rhizobacter sp.]|nr:hypothetical protein [Rhizobacter sp.]